MNYDLEMYIKLFCFGCLVILSPLKVIGQNSNDTLRTVRMTAIVNDQNNTLTIQWKDDPGNNVYRLYRKEQQDTSWGAPLITVNDNDGNYLDITIERGKLYEYQLQKETNNTIGYGYLVASVAYLGPQQKGNLLIIIDSLAMPIISTNLDTYTRILRSEGWIPKIAEVASSTPVSEIKSLILNQNRVLDSLSTVILMGNIAIPHSGNINPDAHSDHKGAWPADLYYGDIDGVWTDQTVNNTSSAYPRIHNIPGDGSFDQDSVPGKIELMVGRIDFSELPIYDESEYALLDNYLVKNIQYRTGEYQVKKRAIYSNLNPWVEGLGQNAIRNFVPIVSEDSIQDGNFFDAFYDAYLWSYGASSGSMICSNGLGCYDTYANNNFQAVFTSNFGSYFGDYDFENAYLRTILASGKVLSAAWVGAPNWYFHPMGLGMNLGYCTLLTQNNTGLYYQGYFPQSVTINLLGDPTLKAFIVQPPSNLTATQNENHVELSWTASKEKTILGYQVYKKQQNEKYFTAISDPWINHLTFVDSCIEENAKIEYLVSAVKYERTPSGTFYNSSSGPITSIQTGDILLPIADFELDWKDGILSGENLSTNANHYTWILPDGTRIEEENFEVTFTTSGINTVGLIATNSCFADTLYKDILITSLSEHTPEPPVQIFPNPAEQFINLSTSVYLDQLRLYNSIGQLVLSIDQLKPGLHQLDIQHFDNGYYLLLMNSKTNTITKQIRLVD